MHMRAFERCVVHLYPTPTHAMPRTLSLRRVVVNTCGWTESVYRMWLVDLPVGDLFDSGFDLLVGWWRISQ